MYETLNDVPLAIRDFYYEETIQEATGNTVAEKFNYLDEKQVEQVGTHQVDEYAPVTYVRLIEKKETWPISKLESLINQGKAQHELDIFATMVARYEWWEQFDKYQAYLLELENITNFNNNLPVIGIDDKGNGILAEAKPIPNEYVLADKKTPDQVLAPYQRELFKAERNEKVSRLKVIVEGMEFDADETSIGRMLAPISTMNDTESTLWVIANNEEVQVTKAQLKKVVKASVSAISAVWVPTIATQ